MQERGAVLHTRPDFTLKPIKHKALEWIWNSSFHKASFFLITAVFCCRWRKDKADIDFSAEDSPYSLMGGNLVISSPVKELHAGSYSCLAANSFGTVVSRQASVQFGCRWHRCEPPPCRLQWCGVELLFGAPVHAYGSHWNCKGSWEKSQMVWTVGVHQLAVAAATTAPVKCFSKCAHCTQPLYMEIKGMKGWVCVTVQHQIVFSSVDLSVSFRPWPFLIRGERVSVCKGRTGGRAAVCPPTTLSRSVWPLPVFYYFLVSPTVICERKSTNYFHQLKSFTIL